MKNRIGLFTHKTRRKKGDPTTTTIYVEVGTLSDLSDKLAAKGAKRVGLLCRERTGTTRIEGKMFAPAELGENHLKWLLAKPEHFETRGIFFE